MQITDPADLIYPCFEDPDSGSQWTEDLRFLTLNFGTINAGASASNRVATPAYLPYKWYGTMARIQRVGGHGNLALQFSDSQSRGQLLSAPSTIGNLTGHNDGFLTLNALVGQTGGGAWFRNPFPRMLLPESHVNFFIYNFDASAVATNVALTLIGSTVQQVK